MCGAAIAPKRVGAATLVGVDLILIPTTPIEGGPLTVRDVGPYAQPAPELSLRFEGDTLIARRELEDFGDPGLPQVAYVEATIGAPAAGQYRLVVENCGGNPPPPVPTCTQVPALGFSVSAAPAIPASGNAAIAIALLAIAAFGAQRIERAFTAFDRLRE